MTFLIQFSLFIKEHITWMQILQKQTPTFYLMTGKITQFVLIFDGVTLQMVPHKGMPMLLRQVTSYA